MTNKLPINALASLAIARTRANQKARERTEPRMSTRDFAAKYRSFPDPTPAFHYEWYEAFDNPELTRILLLAHRESAKTTCVLLYALHALAENRQLRIGIVSKTDEMAVQFMREIKGELQNNADLTSDYGTFYDGSNTIWNQHAVTIKGSHHGKDVSIFAIGAGGQFSGRRVDLMLLDDIETKASVNTAELRASTRSWLAKEAMPTVTPNGRIIALGTRKHFDDIYNYLMNEDSGWYVLDNAKTPFNEDGDPIWPEHWSLEALAKRKAELDAVDILAWVQEYLNTPLPSETIMFDPPSWPTYTALPPDVLIYQAWDLAIRERTQNDYTVCVTIAVDAEQNIYILDVVRKRMSFHNTQLALDEQFQLYNPIVVGIEAVGYQNAAVQEAARTSMMPIVPIILAQTRNATTKYPAGGMTLAGDKVARAKLLEARASLGKVYRPEGFRAWWADFASECVVGETEILTKRGLLRADQIAIGDEVLTHLGRFRAVTATSVRQAPETVTLRGKTLDPITLTPNHLVYAMSVRPNAGGYLAPREKGWVPAGDLSPRRTVLTKRGDVEPTRNPHHAMTFPVLQPDAYLGEIDLRAWFDMTVPPAKVTGRGRRNWAIVDDGETIGIDVGRANRIRYKQQLDYKFGRFCGLYLAEGSGDAWFSFNANEQNLIGEVDWFMTERLGAAGWARESSENCITVGARIPRISKFFDTFGRHAGNKHIPWWAYEAPTEFIRGLVDGWMAGDGCITPQGRVGTTVSKSLAWGIRALATRLGYWASITSHDVRSPSRIAGVQVKSQQRSYLVTLRDREGAASHVFDGEHVGLWITEPVVGGQASVYNFSVEEDESYVTTGGAVHNCAYFPAGAHDDQLDSLSYTVHLAARNAGGWDDAYGIYRCLSCGVGYRLDPPGRLCPRCGTAPAAAEPPTTPALLEEIAEPDETAPALDDPTPEELDWAEAYGFHTCAYCGTVGKGLPATGTAHGLVCHRCGRLLTPKPIPART